jgi:polysaccharide biosynthesis protein PslH
MRIFQICNKSPFPPREGGPIAMNNITQGLLNAGHEVKVLAVNTPKYLIDPERIPENYIKQTGFEAVFIDTSVRVHKAFFNLFSGRSYNVERFVSEEFSTKIKQILAVQKFDIIQLESIYVAPYIDIIRKYSDARIVIRAHNIEHLIWQRLAGACSNPLKKKYLNHLAATLKRFEHNAFNKADGIAAITQVDAAYFQDSGITRPVISIPVGIDMSGIKEIKNEKEFPGIFHLGSMDWMPNQEGVLWFLDHAWKMIHTEFPDIRLCLAGRNMPSSIKNRKQDGVSILGEVENAFEFMQSRTIMIVPLLSGSGMRVKIIEGMACGNTIISTSIGAEGINYVNGEDILIADTPDEFLGQVRKCISDPQRCRNIGLQAKRTISEKYDNKVISGKLIQFYQELLHTVS